MVDPGTDSPFASAGGHGHLESAPDVFELAVGVDGEAAPHAGAALGTRVPGGRADRAAKPKHPVVFECVGVPGMIDRIIADAPLATRVVVVGVCMEPDRVRPAMAINKEIDLRFVLGYTPLEFRDSLHLLADGKVEAAPVVTGTVGLDGVDTAFTALGDPETHAKILIDPSSSATEPASRG